LFVYVCVCVCVHTHIGLLGMQYSMTYFITPA